MRSRTLFVVALVYAVATAACMLPHRGRPGAPAELATHPDVDADAGGALEWRLMTLRGRDGSIPADGITRARAHIDHMRVHARQLHTGSESSTVASQPVTTQMSSAAPDATAASITSPAASALSSSLWRWLGPANVAGRVRSIVVSPTHPQTLFAASVSGGIWRSDDGGNSWRAVDDFMANLAVSSLVIDPVNPDVMYAGTGEVYGNQDALPGAGVFKSTDAGVTWTQLSATSSSTLFTYGVSRLAMSPDGRVLLVSAGGWGGSVFRSTDGGATFSQSNEPGFANDVDFDPANAANAVAAGYGLVYYSRDGGATWRESTIEPVVQGRLEATYAPSQPDTVYFTDTEGEIYVSTDGGASFARKSSGLNFAQGWYNLVLWVNPRNANHLIVGGEQLFESTDGGATFAQISNGSIHVDQHAIVTDPGFDNSTNRTVYFGNDGGVFRADVTAGGSYHWTRLLDDLGITQFYGAAGDANSGQIVGGTQDNGTLLYDPANGTSWSTMLGGDGGFSAIDPTAPTTIYTEYPYLEITRLNSSSPTYIFQGIADAGTSNANFIAPFILDPNNSNRMLAGGLSLWRTNDVTDAQPAWTAIKPGGSESNISAIAVAQGDPNDIWVGHSGGDVYKTTNGTSAAPTWTKVYSTGGTFVTRITIDPTNKSIVYVSSGGFVGGTIARSVDGGAAWASATGSGDTGLPAVPVRDVVVDPYDSSTIYAGTEVGVFVSHDRGGTWALPQDGPANVSVDQLILMGSTLVAATHGRGLFAANLNQSGTATLTVTNQIAFGAQQLQTTSTKRHVVVTSSGTAAVTVQSVRIAAGNTDSFAVDTSGTCAGAVLGPGATCGFDVSFTPQQAGPLQAIVQVSSTAPRSPSEISLTGTGSAGSNVPGPWTSQDIGAAAIAGSASYANGTFTVVGSGADIWGTADAFHYTWQPLAGDGSITARVATVQDVNAWVKAGVMIRASTDPSAAHAALYVTPGKGLALQWRSANGGTTVSQAVTGAAPAWLKLVRKGSSVAASYSIDGRSWNAIATVSVSLPQSALVGLPISSHDNAQTATASIDSVSVGASTLPAPWTQQDIGGVAVAGAASYANGTFTVTGSGADIWGTLDAFHYVWQPLSGDGSITARVASVQDVDAWVKAGVMVRASTDPGAAHAALYVTPGKGIALQWRSANGGTTQNRGVTGAAPAWVKLVRKGSGVTAAYSIDGTSWTTIATVSVALPGTALVGLPVSSHDTAASASATISNVTVSASTIPAPWSQQDVGVVGKAGSAAYANGTFTVSGSGADIWGTADAFHYVWQPLSGNATITARVVTVQSLHAWVKAGVMIRASTDPGAAHASLYVTPGKGIALQWRSAAGGTSLSEQVPGAAPAWVKLVRTASSITASYSFNGTAWTTIATVSVALPPVALVGMPISSHDATQTATATLDSVSVTGIPQ